MILLKVSGIETYYGKIQALKGVSLEVEQGKIVTILRGKRCRKNNDNEIHCRPIKTKDR